jgi:acyl-coenzyme A synthetase/AMP-(fatty) acid ligase
MDQKPRQEPEQTRVPDTISKYPLLKYPLDQPVVMVGSRWISREQFLRDVDWWANALPDEPYIINVCRNRYRFMVAFFAAGIRGHCNLLPAGQQPGYINEILSLHPNACVVFDTDNTKPQGRAFRITAASAPPDWPVSVPKLAGDQLAAIVFTSGSTGTSKPIEKSWHTLYEGAFLNRQHFFDTTMTTGTLFATVPPWHMYGLEWSLMLPMVSDFAVYSGDTFFPDDIRVALNSVTTKRILITTPLHLRAFIKSGLEFPELAGVLCATAPLSIELAQEAEAHLGADLLEVYGCSEIGSMANRWPARGDNWRFFPELKINREVDAVHVRTSFIPESVELSDTLKFKADGSFTLEGRHTDMIKVGGKRASLSELNNRLLSIDGVIDGIFFEAASMGLEDSGRLSALVVAEDLTVKDIRMALAKLIDPVFLPRPLRMVQSLPRMSTGKLALGDLRKLIQKLAQKK